nr:hypothetical protein [uncultured Massilia sp.]
MTAPTCKVPISELAGEIESALGRAPKTIQELCIELGYSRHAVYVRLLDLIAAGRVCYVDVKTKTARGHGVAQRWELGQASQEQLDATLQVRRARAAVADRGPIENPRQVTSRTYPPLRQRDPLVAAFFGHAVHAATRKE